MPRFPKQIRMKTFELINSSENVDNLLYEMPDLIL